MYCPTCQLDSKSEGLTECPICESPLVERRAEADAGEQAARQEQEGVQLQEMIRKKEQTAKVGFDDRRELRMEDIKPQGAEPADVEQGPEAASGATGDGVGIVKIEVSEETSEVEDSSEDIVTPDEYVAGEHANEKLPEAPLGSNPDSGAGALAVEEAENPKDVPDLDASIALPKGAKPIQPDSERTSEPETVGLQDGSNWKELEEGPALEARPPDGERDVVSDVIDQDEPESADSDLEAQPDEEPEEWAEATSREEPQLSAEPVTDLEAPVFTAEGLAQALADADADEDLDEDLTDSWVGESSSRTLLYVAVLVVAVVATGAYYSFNSLLKPPPQQEVTSAKKEVTSEREQGRLLAAVGQEQGRLLAAVGERNVHSPIQPRLAPEAEPPRDVKRPIQARAEARAEAPAVSVARTAPFKVTASTNHASDGIPMKPTVERKMPVRKAAETVRPVNQPPVRQPEAVAVRPTVRREQVANSDLADQPTTKINHPKVVEAEPRVIPIGYHSIQAGSFKTRSSAAGVVNELKNLGFDAYVEQADLGAKGVWYRVKVGEFRTKKEAELKQNELKKVLKADTWIVTRQK